MKKTYRRKVHNALNVEIGQNISFINKILVILILFSIVLVVLETEVSIYKTAEVYFAWGNLFFLVIFSLEYLARIWIAAEDENYHGIAGKIKYMLTPLAIIDLIALIPLYLVFISNSFLAIKIFRILRIFSLLKLNRYSRALHEVLETINQKKYELIVSLGLTFFAILIASACMYALEGERQPEAFGSIPRAMWWGLITLTTIGYGDHIPMSLIGKLFTGFYAIMSLGLVAMVGGIMSGAFVETFEKMKSIDLDQQYPTDEDYQNYESGFIRGKQDKLQHKNYNNPYPQEKYTICAANGYTEGYTITETKTPNMNY